MTVRKANRVNNSWVVVGIGRFRGIVVKVGRRRMNEFGGIVGMVSCCLSLVSFWDEIGVGGDEG